MTETPPVPTTAADDEPDEAALEAGRRLFAHECRFLLGVARLDQVPVSELPEIAFVGRSNVGKSSLLNALTGRNTLARTSNQPGRTQQLNFFDLDGRLMLVDLPGYGYARAPKAMVDQWTRLLKAYLRGRAGLRRCCLLIDARHGAKDVDREMMTMLDAAAVNYQVVLTKVDKLGPTGLVERLAELTPELARHPAAHPWVLATSARDGIGIPPLRAALAALAPTRRNKLGSRRHDSDKSNSPMSEQVLAQAATLSEALPFMKRSAGATFVIKYGGHAMGDPELAKMFARDVVLLKQVGIHPIVVHGGGPQIGDMLKRLAIKSEFVDGLRVTDEATVEVVEMVLAGSINKQIVTEINAAGGVAVGLSGKDAGLIKARKLRRTKRDPESNIERILDLGLVGEPEAINPLVLDVFRRSEDIIPVIAPIGVGPNGETLNINADTAAGAIASAVRARRLMMLTDVAGVLDGEGKLIPEISAARAREMIETGVIHGGMIPKIETCLDAVKQGAEGAVIMDGRLPHSLLVEIFTGQGAGTLIRRA